MELVSDLMFISTFVIVAAIEEGDKVNGAIETYLRSVFFSFVMGYYKASVGNNLCVLFKLTNDMMSVLCTHKGIWVLVNYARCRQNTKTVSLFVHSSWHRLRHPTSHNQLRLKEVCSNDQILYRGCCECRGLL